jgi:uncharacterized protein (TIGR02118 family)
MTVKLVVLYTQPDDATTFDEHYLGEHMTVTGSIPGLQRAETGRFVAAADGGEVSWFRIAELWFDDEATMQSALASDQGKAVAKDYQAIAPPAHGRSSSPSTDPVVLRRGRRAAGLVVVATRESVMHASAAARSDPVRSEWGRYRPNARGRSRRPGYRRTP